jgi:hypothetical protein
MIVFLLWAIVLILFWPLALIIAIAWLAFLIVRIGFCLTVFAIRASAVVGVGGAMAGASMLNSRRRIEAIDQENWEDFKRRMNEMPPSMRKESSEQRQANGYS